MAVLAGKSVLQIFETIFILGTTQLLLDWISGCCFDLSRQHYFYVNFSNGRKDGFLFIFRYNLTTMDMEQDTNSKTRGHLHLVTQAIQDISDIFKDIGFSVVEGPEVETDHYNFEALNFPPDHPARDMQDTFWIKTQNSADWTQKDAEKNPEIPQRESAWVPRSSALLLRTHTSPVQIRYLETHPPKEGEQIAIIVPGKVFRNEATDATHEAQFHQFEGLYVCKSVSMAELKGVLTHFFKKYFGEEAEIRFRPSFFPFVEPGVEVDMLYKKDGKEKWLEMMGAGLMHPNVLEAAGVDSTKWQGFAFGGGIDRLLAIKHGLTDIRELYTGDLRFGNQF
jgi:phenylalanyl-tRNA synthetase alpha chain